MLSWFQAAYFLWRVLKDQEYSVHSQLSKEIYANEILCIIQSQLRYYSDFFIFWIEVHWLLKIETFLDLGNDAEGFSETHLIGIVWLVHSSLRGYWIISRSCFSWKTVRNINFMMVLGWLLRIILHHVHFHFNCSCCLSLPIASGRWRNRTARAANITPSRGFRTYWPAKPRAMGAGRCIACLKSPMLKFTPTANMRNPRAGA